MSCVSPDMFYLCHLYKLSVFLAVSGKHGSSEQISTKEEIHTSSPMADSNADTDPSLMEQQSVGDQQSLIHNQFK